MRDFKFLKALLLFLSSSKFMSTDTKLEKIFDEIDKNKDNVRQIIDYTLKGSGKGEVWNRLADFTDKFGYRLAGSKNLEKSIDYVLNAMKNTDQLDNVHGEKVKVPHWVRGNESAALIHPRYHKLPILSLGYSVGTRSTNTSTTNNKYNGDGAALTAQAIVVRSFDELDKLGVEKAIEGKIVVYNQPFVSYPITVEYRSNGASRAAKYGAVASLIRSVTPFSIDSPHTGMQNYAENVTRIPTACITVEDAEMLDRMYARGEKLIIRLQMNAKQYADVESRNSVAEIKGWKYPQEVVLISGHLDSWDVGQGAMDDGGGAFISWQALTVLRRLKIRPKRTVRAVLWTAEEFGMIGSSQYYQRHRNEGKNFSLVMESDIGTFKPIGLRFTGSKKAAAIMQKVLDTLKDINATRLTNYADGGDVNFWIKNGVPGGSLWNDNPEYFYFHHTNADTMTVQDSDFMDKCSILWTVVAYLVADLEELLPR